MHAIAGQYQFHRPGIPRSHVQVRAGQLRGLAVTARKRLAALPDMPAVAEELPGFEFVGWYGVIGPAGRPAGPITPYQPTNSNPGSSSATAGVSGRAARRLGAGTASPRSLAPRTRACAGRSEERRG